MTQTGHNVQEIDKESGEPTGETATVNIGGHDLDLHLPRLQDIGHPKVPEVNQEYIARDIHGRMDLEVISFAINDPDFFAMLEGEAATGKNFAIKKICAKTNWPMIRVNFGMGTSYESLVGRYAPVDSDEVNSEEMVGRAEVLENMAKRLQSKGKAQSIKEAREIAQSVVPNANNFMWVDGLLTTAVKNGWMFIADEINAAEAEAIMPLNGLLEGREDRYLTIEEKSEIIEPHERFRFVATRNPIDYTGTGDMNSALESRAYVIEFGYHDPMALREILENRTNIVENAGESALDSLVGDRNQTGLVPNIRQQEQSGNEIVTKVSTRDLIKIGRLTDIMSAQRATETVILGIADPTDREALANDIPTYF
jgi:MoxR-like ATPase